MSLSNSSTMLVSHIQQFSTSVAESSSYMLDGEKILERNGLHMTKEWMMAKISLLAAGAVSNTIMFVTYAMRPKQSAGRYYVLTLTMLHIVTGSILYPSHVLLLRKAGKLHLEGTIPNLVVTLNLCMMFLIATERYIVVCKPFQTTPMKITPLLHCKVLACFMGLSAIGVVFDVVHNDVLFHVKLAKSISVFDWVYQLIVYTAGVVGTLSCYRSVFREIRRKRLGIYIQSEKRGKRFMQSKSKRRERTNEACEDDFQTVVEMQYGDAKKRISFGCVSLNCGSSLTALWHPSCTKTSARRQLTKLTHIHEPGCRGLCHIPLRRRTYSGHITPTQRLGELLVPDRSNSMPNVLAINQSHVVGKAWHYMTRSLQGQSQSHTDQPTTALDTNPEQSVDMDCNEAILSTSSMPELEKKQESSSNGKATSTGSLDGDYSLTSTITRPTKSHTKGAKRLAPRKMPAKKPPVRDRCKMCLKLLNNGPTRHRCKCAKASRILGQRKQGIRGRTKSYKNRIGRYHQVHTTRMFFAHAVTFLACFLLYGSLQILSRIICANCLINVWILDIAFVPSLLCFSVSCLTQRTIVTSIRKTWCSRWQRANMRA